MGKKVETFAVGDLVFAKVKGYPAWPAKITTITKSKKYNVYFYGTGETANIQSKDLFPYVQAKKQFATDKNLKRQNFKEAMDQIEAALRGEDSAPLELDMIADSTNTTIDNSTLENTTLDDTTHTANDSDSVSAVLDDPQIGDEPMTEEPAAESTKIEPLPSKDTIPLEVSTPAIVVNRLATTPPLPQTTAIPAELTPPPTAITTPITTKDTPVPPVAIKSDTPKPADGGDVKSRSGRVIKRSKYLNDEFEEPPAITPKRKRPSETPVNKVETDKREQAPGDNTNIREATRLLETEKNIVQFDIDIKSSLQLSSADPAKCIDILECYKDQDLTALMLKKNPNVVETIKRLRRYVGNIKDWNMTEDQRVDFNGKALKVRKLSESIYNSFKKLFPSIPLNVSFWTGFTNEANRFKELTKDLPQDELLALTNEPDVVQDDKDKDKENPEMKNSIRI